MITRQKRMELNALSKEVFGSSSRWQKLVNRGYEELVQEEVTELVPGKTEEDEATTQQTMVPLKASNGAHQYKMVRHTVESVETYMSERKVQLDTIRAQIKKMQDEAKAKKEAEEHAKSVAQQLTGSAL